LAITADNRYIFTSDSDKADVKQFRISDGCVIKHYERLFHGGIASIITTPDSKYLIAGGGSGDLIQICVESQEVVHEYTKIHIERMNCMQITRDSKYLITCAGSSFKKISIANRALEKDFGHVFGSEIIAMKITADQKKLFLGGRKGNLKLMSLTHVTTIKVFRRVHEDWITGIVLTADEKFFLTSS
jgi:WD40 repeat protein